MVFLKAMCVNYQRLLRRLNKKLSDSASQPFCKSCHNNLNSTLQHHRKNLASPSQINFENEESEAPAAPQPQQSVITTSVPSIRGRPVIKDADTTEKKRSKILKPAIAKPSKKKTNSVSDKRQNKVEEKSNKGLITSATMLSVVGLLNYMGNGEVPSCDYSLIQTESNSMPLEQLRVAKVSEARDNDLPENLYDYDNVSEHNSEWSFEQDAQFNPSFDEYDFHGDLVPAKPETVRYENRILNRTVAGLTLEEAYIAYDMRESFLQRHASPLANQSDTMELQTKDFMTRSSNIWKTDDMSLYPEPGSCDESTVNIYEERVSFNF